jgi:hypothetical protein
MVTLLNDLQEGICEGEASPMQLTELYRGVRLLMDETFEAQDQDLTVLLASLEYRARQYKQTIKERLSARN